MGSVPGIVQVSRPARIPPDSLVGWQMLRNRAARLLHTRVWFPHVPLALLVGLTGLAQLLLTSGSLRHLLAVGGGNSTLFSVAGRLATPAIRGVPQEGIGVLLFLVGVGLLWRSRLAWVLAFLLNLATLSLELSPLSTASRSLVVFNIALLALLLLSRRYFTRASLATSTLFALTGVLVALGYGVLGSYVLGAGFTPPISNATNAIYFAVVTMSTVGYGDSHHRDRPGAAGAQCRQGSLRARPADHSHLESTAWPGAASPGGSGDRGPQRYLGAAERRHRAGACGTGTE